MSPVVFAYALVCAALLAGAAAAIEWGVQGRVATRHVWTAAILLSVVIPPAALVWRAQTSSVRPAPQRAAAGLTHAVIGEAPTAIAVANWTVTGHPTSPQRVTTALRARLTRLGARIARHAIDAWAVLSLALAGWLALGLLQLHRARRAWEQTTIDGVSVDIAPATGPAVLGIVSQRIVLPAWAIELPPEQRALMLAHECEHIAARDPQRLALALVALVLMPWNAALWWCAARLRRAIEMDCDARVLRHTPSTRQYGYLLLQVAARGRNTGALAVPMVGLLRLPSELELRLRAMSRPRALARRTAVAGGALALVAIGAAFTTPVPRAVWPISRTVPRATPRATRAPVRRQIARVRVGAAMLSMDSVTYLPGRQQLVGHMVELRVVDTVPRARAADSVAMLARELARKSRELDSARAKIDSMTAAMHEQQAFRITGGRVRLNPTTGVAEQTFQVTTDPRTNHQVASPASLDAAFVRTGGYIESALARYYPDLSPATISADTRIWFVADSTGRVVQTMRDEGIQTSVSAEIAASRFKNVAPSDVGFMSIRRRTIGGKAISIAWIELKR